MTPTGLEAGDAAAAAVAVAPRVSLDQIKALVASENYFVDGTLTICVLTLVNGYKVTGESAAADPANFNEELGRRFARERALAAIWPLAGYQLRDALHRGDTTPAMRCKVVLANKAPNVFLDWSGQHKGGQSSENPSRPDPDDPLNYKVDGANLTFAAVWEGGSPDGKNAATENRIFSDMTPNLLLSATVRNQEVLDKLAPGQTFYVDFIPVPSSPQAS